MSIRRFLILLLISFVWLGCRGQRQSSPSESIPAYLVVSPGATSIKHKWFNGQEQLSYHNQAEYPADDLLNTIKDRLDKLGWKPLKEDFLNPGTPSSLIQGWSFFNDDTTQPKTSVRSWITQWENPSHDIVEYALTYRCPGDLCMSTAQTPRDLRVMAVYVPAALAQRMKSVLQEAPAK